jgi:2',3'-cyclic-nucleotide 2'-phosphodiesterase (5'-nucleotidase family)
VARDSGDCQGSQLTNQRAASLMVGCSSIIMAWQCSVTQDCSPASSLPFTIVSGRKGPTKQAKHLTQSPFRRICVSAMAEEHQPTVKPTVTFNSGSSESSPPDLRILHYNDVYHLDPSSAEPQGGIARFITVCNEYREDQRYQGQPELVTLFSGDAFNPSLESSITKGQHDT